MTEKLIYEHEGVVPVKRPIYDTIRRLRDMPVRRMDSLDGPDTDTDDDMTDERGRHCRPQ